ncbi:MAG: hypothetical protein GXO89_13570 [Chlorobi bacterium]|nr:hypothetical protein [Chlorobiota bacterium]
MKRGYKISVYTLAAVIVLMVVFNFMFSSILRWQVNNFSNGKIHLNSEKASANIFTSSILFEDVLVGFDSVSVDAASKIYLRNLRFSSLKISHISIFQLLFNRNIKVGKISFTDPELNFMRDTVILRKDLFTKVITPEVVKAKSQDATFSFDIGEISIDQGAMHFRGRRGEELDLEKINIRIRDLRLSDLSQMEMAKKDLSAHFKLNVNLYNVRKRFQDAYTFSVDSFSYFSGKKYLLVSGIELTPDSLDDFSGKPEIKFRTDFLRISGFDLNEFIMDENLEFEKFEISNGDLWESKDWFFLNNDDIRDTVKKKNGPGFNWLNTFRTDTFLVNDINVLSMTKKLDTIYEVKKGHLMVLDIRVDSNFLKKAAYLDLTENTFAHSSAIKFHWVKPVIDFRCDTFSFTGDDGREFMKNIRFSQHTYSKDISQRKLLISARVDSLGMKGLNIRRLLKSDSVHLSLFIKNPRLEVYERDSPHRKNKKNTKLSSTIFIDEFRIQDGAFGFASDISRVEAKVENLNLLFDTLQINTKRIGKSGFIDFDGFILDCDGILYKDKKKPISVRIANLFMDKKDLMLRGVRFSEGKAPAAGFSSLEMDGFTVNNFNLKKLINSKEFVCEEIVLQKPGYYGKANKGNKKQGKKTVLSKKIIAGKIAAGLRGKLNKLYIGNINIIDGYVDFQTEKDSLRLKTSLAMKMQNIRFYPNDPSGDTLFYFPDYFQFVMDKPGFSTSKLSFMMDGISYDNSKEELVVAGLSGESVGGDKAKYNIKVPRIELWKPSWDAEKERPFRFASLDIKSPVVFVEINKKEEAVPKKTKKKFVLPFQVDDAVKVLAGKFKLQINKPDDTLGYSIGDFDLEWDAKAGQALGDGSENDLLAAINFDFENIILNSGKSNISLDNIYFDKENNIIEVEGIKQLAWRPADEGGEKKLKNRIAIPRLHIEYPHLYGKPGEPLGLWISNVTANETKFESYAVGGKTKKVPRFKISDSVAMKFLGFFEYVKIDSIYFPNIHIRVNTDTMIRKPIDFKHISFHVNGLLMDSSLLDPQKNSYADDIFVHLHDREVYSADSMYKFRTSYLTYYFSKDQIIIDSLEVIPQFEKDAFFERARFQTDRMQVSTKNVIVDGIDLESIIKTGEYHFDKISINELRLLDHRDQHYPRKEGQYRPLPKEMLENIPVIFHVDTVQVNDSYVLYGEYVDKSEFPGEVFFDNFNASIYNVTNVFKKLDTSFVMTAHLQSKLMGSADLDLTISVPLLERADYFWFDGKVENLDLTQFNSMTQNLFGITIRRGYGDLEIPLISANNSHSLGELTFKYKKFKLAMYNRKKARMNRGIASPLIDFMMNGVLLKSNNPKFLGKTRVGEVYFERDDEKSIFNYIWKSVMSGTLSTMGFNKKEQRQAIKEKKKEMKEKMRKVGK